MRRAGRGRRQAARGRPSQTNPLESRFYQPLEHESLRLNPWKNRILEIESLKARVLENRIQRMIWIQGFEIQGLNSKGSIFQGFNLKDSRGWQKSGFQGFV